MIDEQLLTDIVDAVCATSEEDVLRLSAELATSLPRFGPAWVIVEFEKSAKTPNLRVLRPYNVSVGAAEQALLRGPFRLNSEPLDEIALFDETTSREIFGEQLSRVFNSGVLYVPIPDSMPFRSGISPAGAILVEANQRREPSPGGFELNRTSGNLLAVVRLACGAALKKKSVAEAWSRMPESLYLSLTGAIQLANTPRETCAAVLEVLNSYVRHESGVLYLLDPDPGRNEYLIYGASRNENAESLYRSFFPREALGFTWDVAISQKVRVGSLADVPSSARHTNDAALAHLRVVHDAWALVPLLVGERTRAVVHLEGLNLGDGASGADIGILRTLSRRIGTPLAMRLEELSCQSKARPSIQTSEHLCQVLKREAEARREGLENFVRMLFKNMEGALEVVVEDVSRLLPQIDGLFFMRNTKELLAVEVKAPDEIGSSVGVEALRQLTHQMEATGVHRGFLVTSSNFAARTAGSLALDKVILVIDGGRLERLAALSQSDREAEFRKWATVNEPGVYVPNLS